MRQLLLLAILLLAINLVCAAPLQITTDSEFHANPDSASGITTLVYVCDNYVCKDVRGGGSETIISSSDANYPDINADGEIVYRLFDGLYYQVYKNIGGSETQLTTSSWNKYYPDTCFDGDTVVFWGDDGGGYNHIYKTSISSGGETQLTSGSFDDGPGAQNDGIINCGDTDVVFARNDGSNWQIAKVPIAGGAVTMLTSSSWDKGDPDWNVDYSEIAYWGYDFLNSGFATIHTMTSSGGSDTARTSGANNYYYPFYCPDGTLYAFHNEVLGTDYLSQILPSVSDLYAAAYSFAACDSVASYDIFFTQNDGTYDQVWQDHGGDANGGPVPEFSTMTLLLAALVALGGIFAFRRYR